MYYRCYRRRHNIFLAVTVVLVIFFLMRQNSTTSSTTANDEGGRLVGGEHERKARISIETYQQPKNCYGCPGENGAGVSLTVSYCYFFR